MNMNVQKKKMRVKKKIGILMLTDYNYDVDEEGEQRFIEEYGANITIQLRDGRYFLHSFRPWLLVSVSGLTLTRIGCPSRSRCGR